MVIAKQLTVVDDAVEVEIQIICKGARERESVVLEDRSAEDMRRTKLWNLVLLHELGDKGIPFSAKN